MDKLKSHGYYSVFELFIGATNGFDNFGENFDWRGKELGTEKEIYLICLSNDLDPVRC